MPAEGVKLNDTYTLLEEIGSGGGGIVYKAYHERLKTYVVVKKVRQRVRNILESRAEADILKNIKHTYLPRVYDFLEIDGEIYTVMDFIPGKSLKEMIEEKPSISQKRLLKWATQLSQALDYLHRQTPPVIHSDIKPSNIMVTPEDDVCLIDFNISLAFNPDMRTSTGTSAGYSPPEQYRDYKTYEKTITRLMSDLGVSDPGVPGLGKPGGGRMPGHEGAFPQNKWNGNRETGAGAADRSSAGPAADETETMAAPARSGVDETETMAALAHAGVDETETMAAPARADGDGTETMAAAPVPGTDGRRRASGERAAGISRITGDIMGCGVDERSDVYSLGATLYHLACGKKPDPIFEHIIPVRQAAPGLSEGCSCMIDKMMELDPSRRYQNGGEVLYALNHIRELDSDYRRYKRSRRARKLGLALLYTTGAVCIGLGAVTVHRENTALYNRNLERAGDCMESGDYEEAAKLINSSLELYPSRIEAYRQEALRLYEMGDYEGCVRYGRDVINNPEYVVETEEGGHALGDLFYLVGNGYFETEDYAGAYACFQKAIEYNKTNSLYFRDSAIASARTGNISQAEESLDTAIGLGLGEDSIYMAQGEISYSKGEYAEAERQLLQTIRTTEDVTLRRRAVLLCDKAYRFLGDRYVDDDLALLEQAQTMFGAQPPMALTERLADAYVRKARSVRGGGSSDETIGDNTYAEEAVQYKKRALEIFLEIYENGYTTLQIMENISILYQDMEAFDQARAMMNQMVSGYPDSYRGYMRLAFLEGDIQQQRENKERDYGKMKEYFGRAEEIYHRGEDEDAEMGMLENLMRDLEEGGWFS